MIEMGNGWTVSLKDDSCLQKLSYEQKKTWWYNIKKITPTQFTSKERANEAKTLLEKRTKLQWIVSNSLFLGHYHEKRQRI
jgi:hypothetical protein